jgi:hypothetical protein
VEKKTRQWTDISSWTCWTLCSPKTRASKTVHADRKIKKNNGCDQVTWLYTCWALRQHIRLAMSLAYCANSRSWWMNKKKEPPSYQIQPCITTSLSALLAFLGTTNNHTCRTSCYNTRNWFKHLPHKILYIFHFHPFVSSLGKLVWYMTTDYRYESWTGLLSCFESTNSSIVTRNYQK